MTKNTGSLEHSESTIVEWSINGNSLMITERTLYDPRFRTYITRVVCIFPLDALRAALEVIVEQDTVEDHSMDYEDLRERSSS